MSRAWLYDCEKNGNLDGDLDEVWGEGKRGKIISRGEIEQSDRWARRFVLV